MSVVVVAAGFGSFWLGRPTSLSSGSGQVPAEWRPGEFAGNVLWR
ncbi:hypothetical protein [Actinomadura keratinilytica]